MKAYCKNCLSIQPSSFRSEIDAVTGSNYEDLCCDSCHFVVATIQERDAAAQPADKSRMDIADAIKSLCANGELPDFFEDVADWIAKGAMPTAQPAQEPVAQSLIDALTHAVEIAEAKRPGAWDDLLQYRALLATPPAAPVQEPKMPEFFAELEYNSPDWDVFACVYRRRADAAPELVHREQMPRQTAPVQPIGTVYKSQSGDTCAGVIPDPTKVKDGDKLYAAAAPAAAPVQPGQNHYEDGDVFERIAAMKKPAAQPAPVTDNTATWSDELALIESVLKGYPDSIAKADALRAVRGLQATPPSPGGNLLG
jgi:hypothetical protein